MSSHARSLAVAGLLVLAACGSEGSDTPTAEESTPATSTTAAPSTTEPTTTTSTIADSGDDAEGESDAPSSSTTPSSTQPASTVPPSTAQPALDDCSTAATEMVAAWHEVYGGIDPLTAPARVTLPLFGAFQALSDDVDDSACPDDPSTHAPSVAIFAEQAPGFLALYELYASAEPIACDTVGDDLAALANTAASIADVPMVGYIAGVWAYDQAAAECDPSVAAPYADFFADRVPNPLTGEGAPVDPDPDPAPVDPGVAECAALLNELADGWDAAFAGADPYSAPANQILPLVEAEFENDDGRCDDLDSPRAHPDLERLLADRAPWFLDLFDLVTELDTTTVACEEAYDAAAYLASLVEHTDDLNMFDYAIAEHSLNRVEDCSPEQADELHATGAFDSDFESALVDP